MKHNNKVLFLSIQGGSSIYSMIVVYSRDHKGVGMAHEIISPKNQPQFQYWLGKTKPKQAF